MAQRTDPPAMPRWVKVFGIITVLVIVTFLILMLTRGPGGHGPRRHMQLGECGLSRPPAAQPA